MKEGPITKAVDNKSSNYTSDAVDCRGYDHLFLLTHDEGSFAGSIVVKALLATVDENVAEETSGSDYKQYGRELVLDRVEVLENVPPFIKIAVTRTAGAVSVWVQPFSRG